MPSPYDGFLKAYAEGVRRSGLLLTAFFADGGESQGPAWCRTAAALGLTPDLRRIEEDPCAGDCETPER
jgi:hypothetical protein